MESENLESIFSEHHRHPRPCYIFLLKGPPLFGQSHLKSATCFSRCFSECAVSPKSLQRHTPSPQCSVSQGTKHSPPQCRAAVSRRLAKSVRCPTGVPEICVCRWSKFSELQRFQGTWTVMPSQQHMQCAPWSDVRSLEICKAVTKLHKFARMFGRPRGTFARGGWLEFWCWLEALAQVFAHDSTDYESRSEPPQREAQATLKKWSSYQTARLQNAARKNPWHSSELNTISANTEQITQVSHNLPVRSSPLWSLDVAETQPRDKRDVCFKLDARAAVKRYHKLLGSTDSELRCLLVWDSLSTRQRRTPSPLEHVFESLPSSQGQRRETPQTWWQFVGGKRSK